MKPTQNQLPDFEYPPAVETLLGFQFESLRRWQTPYFGLFWQEIKRQYSTVQVHPPVTSEDGLKVEVTANQANIRVSGEIPVRWWYFHNSGKRLIQVQNNSFFQNWRKRGEKDAYLHYDDLRPAFEDLWAHFLAFLKKHNVGTPMVRFCEVTYVNHVDRGVGWTSFADLPNVVRCWTESPDMNFLPQPSLVAFNVVYPFEDGSGNLHASLQPGRREADKKETLQLTLTARCKPKSSNISELLRCLDLDRYWVVRGFHDLTTPKMHELWGEKKRRVKRSI